MAINEEARSPEGIGWFQGHVQELRRVVWPTRAELFRMTSVVVFTVFAISLFIAAVDGVLDLVAKGFYGSGS